MAAVTVAARTASVVARRPSTPRSGVAAKSAAAITCAARFDQRKGGPVGQQHRQDGAEERGDAVEPDLLARVRHVKQVGGPDRGRLQPVDPHRLLVARLVPEPDGDEVRGLEHLLRGLGEAGLVAVHRRQGEEARQQHDERDDDQERDGSDAGQDCLESAFDAVALGHAYPSLTTDIEVLRTETLARCRWVFASRAV